MACTRAKSIWKVPIIISIAFNGWTISAHYEEAIVLTRLRFLNMPKGSHFTRSRTAFIRNIQANIIQRKRLSDNEKPLAYLLRVSATLGQTTWKDYESNVKKPAFSIVSALPICPFRRLKPHTSNVAVRFGTIYEMEIACSHEFKLTIAPITEKHTAWWHLQTRIDKPTTDLPTFVTMMKYMTANIQCSTVTTGRRPESPTKFSQ